MRGTPETFDANLQIIELVDDAGYGFRYLTAEAARDVPETIRSMRLTLGELRARMEETIE